MIIILYVALGVILGFLTLILIIWFWLKYKFRKLTAKFADELAQAVQDMGGFAPPLRIELEPADELDWSDPERFKMITSALNEVGFAPVGLFEAYAPMPIKIQGFKNNSLPGFATLFEIEQAGKLNLDLKLDLSCTYSDGSEITVSTSPDDGLEPPPFSKIIRLPHLDLTQPQHIQELYQRLQDEVQGKTLLDQSDKRYQDLFEETWARSMDWRVDQGGITTAEVIRMAEINDRPHPSAEEIELSQLPWRHQIDEHITEQIRKSYLKNTSMSGVEWEETMDRLVIVHERSVATRLISELADMISYDADQDDTDSDGDPYLEAEQRLKAAFDSESSVMEGFRKALELLPPRKEYTLQGSTESPWKSDVYLSPSFDDDNFEDHHF